jgi:hypothetical protein
MKDKFTNTPSKSVMEAKIFDLVMGRVFKRVYLELDKADKKKMEEVFSSDDDKIKEEFIKKYIPNFEELFKEEAEKIGKEIQAQI